MAEPRSPQTAKVALAAGCALAAAGLIAFAMLRDRAGPETAGAPPAEEPGPTAAAVPSEPAPEPSPAPAAQPEPAAPRAAEGAAPRLDLVRVEPDGAALLAGRAAPGAEVTVRAGDRVLATVEADASGSFVAAFDAAPFDAPGAARDLTLSSAAEGAPPAETALVLPAPPAAPEAPGGFTPAAGATPEPPPATPAVEPAVAARAAPASEPAPPASAPVASFVAEPAAGAAPAPAEAAVAPEPPAESPPPAAAAAPAGASGPRRAADVTVVVEPGSTLWGLAREHYGAGRRYPTIVTANPEEIADPALIFPGQRLILPPAAD